MPHQWLLVFADEDAVRRGAVEVVKGGKDLCHSVHEMSSQKMILSLTVLVLRLGLEPAQLTGEMGSGTLLIFGQ